MYRSIYDLRSFYNSRMGRVVRRILQQRLSESWPETHGLRIMGAGYATPYLRAFQSGAECLFAAMPAGQGAHIWPTEGPSCVVLCESAELPFETNSIDRVILIHELEFCEFLQPALKEIWRVLKSTGRLIVVVPNRNGLWAWAEWSPFGRGTPYSAAQIEFYLRDNLFVHERTEGALFIPPLRNRLMEKFAGLFESIGRKCPLMPGVYIVEASKQIYATPMQGGSKSPVVRGRRALFPKPATISLIKKAPLNKGGA